MLYLPSFLSYSSCCSCYRCSSCRDVVGVAISTLSTSSHRQHTKPFFDSSSHNFAFPSINPLSFFLFLPLFSLHTGYRQDSSLRFVFQVFHLLPSQAFSGSLSGSLSGSFSGSIFGSFSGSFSGRQTQPFERLQYHHHQQQQQRQQLHQHCRHRDGHQLFEHLQQLPLFRHTRPPPPQQQSLFTPLLRQHEFSLQQP